MHGRDKEKGQGKWSKHVALHVSYCVSEASSSAWSGAEATHDVQGRVYVFRAMHVIQHSNLYITGKLHGAHKQAHYA